MVGVIIHDNAKCLKYVTIDKAMMVGWSSKKWRCPVYCPLQGSHVHPIGQCHLNFKMHGERFVTFHYIFVHFHYTTYGI